MLKIKREEYDSKTFRLPTELIEKLAEIASKNNISMNKLVIQCLNYAIDNLDDECCV